MKNIRITEHAFEKTGHVRWLLGRAFLRLMGWRLEGELPQCGAAVIIAAPHTSNWDMFYMLAVAWSYRVKLSWLGKHTIFRPPFGWLLKKLGGIPVDRRQPGGLVEQAAARLRTERKFLLLMAPSGTRGKRPCWKSGFYHIAHSANVPVICSFLDYGRRVTGIGPSFLLEGNPAVDMKKIRGFYSGMQGKRPECMTPALLREEIEDAETAGGARAVLEAARGEGHAQA
ncbi:MAG: lysophospholipid acyltransferase family protein [Candidatus Schekmanbacteria bacterium]|nr:lysophospholipid acyltransferase family protein [Candidatus Schekmanbacteria bacterium]